MPTIIERKEKTAAREHTQWIISFAIKFCNKKICLYNSQRFIFCFRLNPKNKIKEKRDYNLIKKYEKAKLYISSFVVVVLFFLIHSIFFRNY